MIALLLPFDYCVLKYVIYVDFNVLHHSYIILYFTGEPCKSAERCFYQRMMYERMDKCLMKVINVCSMVG